MALKSNNDPKTTPLDARHVHNSEVPATFNNRHINKLIETINSKKDLEQILGISARKDNLSQIPLSEFLEITDILYHNHHAFTEKKIIPKLTENLNINSISSLLDSLQEVYATTTTNGKDKEALFEEKKNAVQQKIALLQTKGFIHNRLLLGLFLVMNYEKHLPEINGGQMNKFQAGHFLKDINNRLFFDENKDLFWQQATTQGTQQVQDQTTNELHKSLH